MDTHLLAGTVQSGGTSTPMPLADAQVTVYDATGDTPVVIGRATTDQAGRFSIHNPDPSASTIFYATASRGEEVLLVTIIGPEITGEIVINELTTVAAAFSMAQFANGSTISGNALGLRIAAGMSDNLVSAGTGESSEVMLHSPNADESNSLRSTRALANLIAPSVNQLPGAFGTLQELATPPGGPAPADTFQALVNIARNPGNSVGEIYDQALADANAPYQPSLEQRPVAWTLAVKVNRTGDDGQRMFGGPANIAWDRNGYAWINNNVFQGHANSCDFIVVLQPNGKPADGTNGTVKSPVVGGGILGPGFGIDIDGNDNVWVGSFGWGTEDYIPDPGIVSKFDLTGTAANDDGYVGNTCRVQGMAVDDQNNVWLASYGTNSVVVFPNGDPDSAICYPPCPDGVPNPPPEPPKGPERPGTPETPGTCTFGVALARDEQGGAWVTYGSGLGWPQANPGAVARYRINTDNSALVPVFEPLTNFGAALKGLAVDSHGNPVAKPTYAVENLVLNPAGSGGTRYLVLSVSFSVRDSATVTKMKDRDAELRDILLKVLGDKTVPQLADMAARPALKAEVRAHAGRLFGEKTITDVFFPQFVIQ